MEIHSYLTSLDPLWNCTAMEFHSYLTSLDPLWNCTAMEIHSYLTSLDPLWNSTARMGASEEPVSVALPAVPSCDIKPVFY
jgi:hypothetical protein